MAGTEYVVKATDAASAVFAKIGLSAENLDKQLHDLSDRVATPEVNLEDTKFSAGIVKAAERIDKLSAMVANPEVEVDTRKAQLEIFRITAMLDRLGAKRVDVTVGVDRSFLSRLGPFGSALRAGGGLLGGAGSLIGSGAQNLGSGIGAIGNSLGNVGAALQGGGIAAAIAAAILAGPALLPLGLGGLIGGGAAGGALMLGARAQKQLKTLQTSLRSATGARRENIADQIAAIQQRSGGQLATFAAFQELGRTGLGVFSSALQTGGPPAIGPNGRPIAGSGAPSFLTGLNAILEQIGRFIRTLGPQLASMFRASLPFLQLFVHFLEQAAKTLLPVFTQMLQQMTPFLPLMSKGLMNIVQGLAGFLKAIGPSGMQAAAKIFVVVTKGMDAVLVALGHTINWLVEHVPTWAHNIAAWWDRLRHDTDVIFTTIRHDIASFFHGISTDFDTWRHGWAHIWDSVYNDTIGVVIRIDRDVIGWFKKIPGQVIGALEGLGTDLYNFAHMAMSKLWNGLKTVFGDVWSWFKSLPGKLLNAIGIHSPPDWAIEAGKHIMGGLLHGIISRKDELLSKFQAISGGMGSIAGRLTGPQGGIQALAQRIAGTYGWAGQWGAINAVAMRESGWSMTAQNKSSGAYGIAQFINGPSEYYQYGGNPNTAAGQIVGFYNYIKQRYGSPGAAWQHELNFGWYDRGGWLPPGLSLALNQTGAPERVGGGPGNVYNIHVHVPPSANKADMGRQVVEVIREYEKRSGAGWRR